jgi:hypothetical protein
MPPAYKPGVAEEKPLLRSFSNIAIRIADHHAIVVMDGYMRVADFDFD